MSAPAETAETAVGAARPPSIERLVHTRDFERLLAIRPCRRSAHFALHRAAAGVAGAAGTTRGAVAGNLSTIDETVCPQPVDESPRPLRFGCVVPKRHARRAVTRSLLKRQVRAAFGRHAAALGDGDFLVRLTAPFAPAAFPSAASRALARAARGELDRLLVPPR